MRKSAVWNLTLFHELVMQLGDHLLTLPDKPEETADNTLRALWLASTGVMVSAERAGILELPDLDETSFASLQRLVARRIAGEPLAYITGRQSFMGLELAVGPNALIPRKETELLARAAVDIANTLAREQTQVTVVDVCTGAGTVALAVAANEPKSVVFGSDLSPGAVDIANHNKVQLGLSERVTFLTGDLMKPFETPEFLGKVDILTCNPPYISSSKVDAMAREIIGFEPRMAFDGGPFGVQILSAICNDVPRLLRPGGWFCLEVGGGQGPGIRRLLTAKGAFAQINTVVDSAGQIRALTATTR